MKGAWWFVLLDVEREIHIDETQLAWHQRTASWQGGTDNWELNPHLVFCIKAFFQLERLGWEINLEHQLWHWNPFSCNYYKKRREDYKETYKKVLNINYCSIQLAWPSSFGLSIISMLLNLFYKTARKWIIFLELAHSPFFLKKKERQPLFK